MKNLIATIAVILVMASCEKPMPKQDNVLCDQPYTLQEYVEHIAPDSLSQVVCAIIAAESGWDCNAVSPTGDHGLMQINKRWWGKKFDFRRIYEPGYNVRCGVYILQQCLMQSGGDIRGALTIYNGSSAYVDVVNRKHKEMYGTELP